jgi:hypothetical protein
MSQFVNEILNSIYSDRNIWKKYANGTGIEKENIKIFNFGNTKLLSVVHVEIEHQDIPLTYTDKWKLEKAVGWWYKNVELETLLA